MNQKTAKILRSYVGVRRGEKSAVALKDVRRRFLLTPRPHRGLLKDAMLAYMDHRGYTLTDRAKARLDKARRAMGTGPGRSGFSGLLNWLWALVARRETA